MHSNIWKMLLGKCLKCSKTRSVIFSDITFDISEGNSYTVCFCQNSLTLHDGLLASDTYSTCFPTVAPSCAWLESLWACTFTISVSVRMSRHLKTAKRAFLCWRKCKLLTCHHAPSRLSKQESTPIALSQWATLSPSLEIKCVQHESS